MEKATCQQAFDLSDVPDVWVAAQSDGMSIREGYRLRESHHRRIHLFRSCHIHLDGTETHFCDTDDGRADEESEAKRGILPINRRL
ncbi:MAG: hypothetical protein HY685_04280 [Chloroflexi bacterium]|nr:hypothetical protein [Chloroflexota bacterium]